MDICINYGWINNSVTFVQCLFSSLCVWVCICVQSSNQSFYLNTCDYVYLTYCEQRLIKYWGCEPSRVVGCYVTMSVHFFILSHYHRCLSASADRCLNRCLRVSAYYTLQSSPASQKRAHISCVWKNKGIAGLMMMSMTKMRAHLFGILNLLQESV